MVWKNLNFEGGIWQTIWQIDENVVLIDVEWGEWKLLIGEIAV
jgi:hypothetical protein